MQKLSLITIGVSATALLLSSCSAASAPSAAKSSGSRVATATDTATATPVVLPRNGPVEPGTYHVAPSAWSIVGFTMIVPEGWQTQYGAPGLIKHSDEPGELAFYFVIVDAIYSDPCLGEGELVDVGPSVDDLVNALLEQPVVLAAQPVDTTLGGLPATRIDLTVPADLDAEACRMGEQLQIWYSPPADKYFVLLGDGTASVYILDVEGERQVLLTQYRAGATPEDVTEMQTIVESIEIGS